MKKCVITDNLLENKRMIASILCERNKSGIFILKDALNLNPEDTERLCKQFTSINSTEDLQRFCICIIVGWIESYRNHLHLYFAENMKERIQRIPQHAQGKYLKIYQNTFFEYGLDTFSCPFESIEQVDEVVRKHAGL